MFIVAYVQHSFTYISNNTELEDSRNNRVCYQSDPLSIQ